MAGLENDFRALLERFEVAAWKVDELWQEVAAAHDQAGRHYHTLRHLEHLYAELTPLSGQLQDPDAVLLAIVYHDFVYKVSRSDNEERSAIVMRERMSRECGLPEALVQRTEVHIHATKRHEAGKDPDTDLFTDADLGILGADTERYQRYAQEVRKEFRVYPDLLYKPGRRKVLQHFLEMERIFKTDHFRERYEEQARRNLEKELASL